MSRMVELLCSAPVLLLWLLPVAVVLFCVAFDGCRRLARLFGHAPHAPLPPTPPA